MTVKKYNYDEVKLVKHLCSNPMDFGNLIAKCGLYIRETGNIDTFKSEAEINNPFKKGETIKAIFSFKTLPFQKQEGQIGRYK